MALYAEVISGNRRALARAATLIEAQTEVGRELSRKLFAHTGRALTIGVTGAPGVGKSTLVNALIGAYREQRKTVGVIAVDPSSPYSQGALLGDRVRMLAHHADAGVFIRSMATRGRLGGLAATTLDIALLLDAAGFDIVLIETVGVGQDELDIANLAEITVLVLTPAGGDDIQAQKAGILEIADVIVINKADLPGTEQLHKDILDSQSLLPEQRPPPVVKTSIANKQSISDLVSHIESCERNKSAQDQNWEVWSHRLSQKLRDDLLAELPVDLLRQYAKKVSEKIEDPDSAIMALKAELFAGRHGA